MKQTKIAIITPVYFDYPQLFVASLLACITNAKHFNIEFGLVSPCGCSNITQARNISIQDLFIQELKNKAKFDYLMFIDSDIQFSIENILQLLKRDKDVVSGIYFAKSKPHFPVCGFYDLKRISNGFPKLNKEQILSKQLLEVDWTGNGFILMKRNVIDKIEYPWFDMRVIDLLEPAKRDGNITIKKEILSEDISFCCKIKEAGFKIFADTSILLKHAGNQFFSVDHFLALN